MHEKTAGWIRRSRQRTRLMSPDDNLVFETDVFVEGPGGD